MKTPIIALALLLLPAGTAFSHEKDKDHRSEWREKLLKQYDKNGDGNLDDEERTAMKKAWAKKWENRKGGWGKHRKHYHKDGDGKFNHDEHHARHKKKRGKRGGFTLSRHLMTHFDANKDDEISADEVPQSFHKYFKSVDANVDGTVNQKEISQAVKKMVKRKFVSYVQSRVFDKIDQNDDGKLDIEKIVAKMHVGLNKIDTSDDGFIDRSEFKAITSPPPVKQADSSEQPDDVQAELARLRQAIEKLAESLKDRE